MPKPPKLTKAELMERITKELGNLYPGKPESALQWALNYFTSVDLNMMYDELVEKKRDRSKSEFYRNVGIDEPDQDKD